MEVEVEIFINKIPYVDTFGLKITVDFYINLIWNDYRVTFKNLKEDKFLNTLSHSMVKNIWTPNVRLSNALGAVVTKHDQESLALIIREAEPVSSDLSFPFEGEFGIRTS